MMDDEEDYDYESNDDEEDCWETNPCSLPEPEDCRNIHLFFCCSAVIPFQNMSLLVWLFYVLLTVSTFVLCSFIAVLISRRFKSETPDPIEYDDLPNIRVDPAKAFAQQVKFMMRLKRKMKTFKENKAKNELSKVHDWFKKIIRISLLVSFSSTAKPLT